MRLQSRQSNLWSTSHALQKSSDLLFCSGSPKKGFQAVHQHNKVWVSQMELWQPQGSGIGRGRVWTQGNQLTFYFRRPVRDDYLEPVPPREPDTHWPIKTMFLRLLPNLHPNISRSHYDFNLWVPILSLYIHSFSSKLCSFIKFLT